MKEFLQFLKINNFEMKAETRVFVSKEKINIFLNQKKISIFF